jgi:hypothetical protein
MLKTAMNDTVVIPLPPLSNPLPVYFEPVPDELAVRVYHHAVPTRAGGEVPCWSYVTDGLRRHGQQELVFTLRRRSGETQIPQDPLDFFARVLRQLGTGQVLEAGGFSRYRSPDGFLGRTGTVGLIYVPAVPLRGVNYADRPLSALLLAPGEVEWVAARGNYRVLSLLGQWQQHYPWPPWNERDRPAVLSGLDLRHSLLGQVPVAHLPLATVTRKRNRVYFQTRRCATRDLRDRLGSLPQDPPFALLTDPDPAANARLVWRPGRPVGVIGTDDSAAAVLTGGFVAFAAAPNAEEGAHLCEDGFAVRVRPDTWRRLREALEYGGQMTVAAEGAGMRFVLGPDTGEEPAELVATRFLQPDPVVQSRVDVTDLTAYYQRLAREVEEHFAGLPADDGQTLTLVCMVRPGREVKFWLCCQPDDLPEKSRAALERRLRQWTPPAAHAGPIAWALQFHLWGGAGDDDPSVPLPRQWAAVCPPGQSLMIPDAVLTRVWSR